MHLTGIFMGHKVVIVMLLSKAAARDCLLRQWQCFSSGILITVQVPVLNSEVSARPCRMCARSRRFQDAVHIRSTLDIIARDVRKKPASINTRRGIRGPNVQTSLCHICEKFLDRCSLKSCSHAGASGDITAISLILRLLDWKGAMAVCWKRIKIAHATW